MENCTPIGGVFFWNNPNGIDVEVGKLKGGEINGPAVWPNCTSFRIFLLIMEGLSLADRRLEYSWGVRGP